MNRLSQSTSPYLLQHAHNPVDWYPWGQEALARAKSEDKPIFLSIGYAACHWCHVMAHESFEDPQTAAFMNEHFINIKVDREERPDIDSIYMQAVVAMTGSGGWPMSVFMSPDLKPFYAGTYFPPTRRYNKPAFKELLSGLANAWRSDRGEIDRVGGQVDNHLKLQNSAQGGNELTAGHLSEIAKSIQSSYDWGYGGWGDAPKFPQPMVLEFLLHHSSNHENKYALKLVKHCLHAMARGGMYDVVGGGFARYSTDHFWRVPHFEKMLYDNALLTRIYLHAWQVSGEPAFRRIVDETLGFVMREMTDSLGGFYSSLDADSEGVEGKFYVWTLDEIRSVLGDDSDFFESAYGISAQGNWEGKTILQHALDDASLAARFKLDLEAVSAKFALAHSRLLSARDLRIRPTTDDKVLTSWNGLMLAAFSEAARVFNNRAYIQLATRNADFLLENLRPDHRLRHAWRAGRTTNEGFLEDYSALILGLLELYQTCFDNKWFSAAQNLADEMIERFHDPTGGFFDTAYDGETLLIRPKDIQDNATPCGNALAGEALLKLSAYTDEGKYRDLAEKSLALIPDAALRYPLGFARWLSAAESALGSIKQVAVMGDPGEKNFGRMLSVIHDAYRPDVVVAASRLPLKENSPALLRGRSLLDNKTTAYVCEGFICRQPTNEIETLVSLLSSKE